MLKPALRENTVKAPSHWQQLPHGHWLQQQVCAALTPHCERVFGYHMARVGHLAKAIELPGMQVKHQFSVASSGIVDVLAEPTQWPFAEGVLDAVLIAGLLEFERDPHQILREIARSLIADGHLLLVGFNPLSPSLLTGFWPTQLRKYPWSGRFFTRPRVADWLALLNFEVIATEYIAPSMLIERVTPPSRGLQTIAQLLPQCGSMYYMVARKREFPLTFMRKAQRVKAPMNSMPVANRMER